MEPSSSFSSDVYKIVERIPAGRVMTYGQIAAVCGHPRAARQVGQAAHWGPHGLPWQRVVHKDGSLARGYTTGGYEAHKRDLAADGVAVDRNYKVIDLERRLWWPDE